MGIDIRSKTKIDIDRDSSGEAAEVLALAFEDDPFIRYLFPGQADISRVRQLFHFICESRLELEWPLIGTASEGKLTGVACVSMPEKKKWPPALTGKYEILQSSIGDISANRMSRFSKLSQKYAPKQSHCYLAVLGIHPEFQERGLGAVLVDAVGKMSESHPESTGVFLETAKQANVTFYEHFGYRLVAKDKLDDIVDFWYMFRPNKA